MCKLLVLVLAVVVATASAETADLGHGFQILSKIVRQYLNSQPEDVKISDGVHLVSVRSDNDARANTDDKTVLGAVENYLQNHELRIRLPELMPGEGFGRAFKDALDNIEGNDAGKKSHDKYWWRVTNCEKKHFQISKFFQNIPNDLNFKSLIIKRDSSEKNLSTKKNVFCILNLAPKTFSWMSESGGHAFLKGFGCRVSPVGVTN
jgi:hypothetical protein